VFGSEFVLAKTGVDGDRGGLRYKWWMMGVPLLAATYMFGDNVSVITNTSKLNMLPCSPRAGCDGRNYDSVGAELNKPGRRRDEIVKMFLHDQ
jgi:hypothetical protein